MAHIMGEKYISIFFKFSLRQQTESETILGTLKLSSNRIKKCWLADH